MSPFCLNWFWFIGFCVSVFVSTFCFPRFYRNVLLLRAAPYFIDDMLEKCMPIFFFKISYHLIHLRALHSHLHHINTMHQFYSHDSIRFKFYACLLFLIHPCLSTRCLQFGYKSHARSSRMLHAFKFMSNIWISMLTIARKCTYIVTIQLCWDSLIKVNRYNRRTRAPLFLCVKNIYTFQIKTVYFFFIFGWCLYNSRMNWTENVIENILLGRRSMKNAQRRMETKSFAFDFFECHDSTELNRPVECYKYVTLLPWTIQLTVRFKCVGIFYPWSCDKSLLDSRQRRKRERNRSNMKRLG